MTAAVIAMSPGAVGGCAGVLRASRRRRPRLLEGLTGPEREAAVARLWTPGGAALGLWTPTIETLETLSSLGVTYLLCFRDETGEKAWYAHAGHYLGSALDLDIREAQHRAGTARGGARLLEVIQEAGLTWVVARVWPGTDRDWEAQLKRWRIAPKLCPLCEPDSAARRALRPFATPVLIASSWRTAA